MTENQEPKPVSGQRRRRRGHRGGRRHRRGARAPQSAVAPATAGVETPAQAPGLLEAVARVAGQISPARQPQHSAISRAIDEVSQIIESLKRVLDQMEEVLELAELAERQKTADEQEIESLRRALRQLHRPTGPRRRGEQEARG